MLAFLEKTWPIWWIFATVVLLRWFHVNSQTPDDWETHTRTPAAPPPRIAQRKRSGDLRL